LNPLRSTTYSASWKTTGDAYSAYNNVELPIVDFFVEPRHCGTASTLAVRSLDRQILKCANAGRHRKAFEKLLSWGTELSSLSN
jgi:hypothetical protein